MILRESHYEWEKWFAWRPVRLEDGRWVWWTWVERRKTRIVQMWEYRRDF